MENNIDLSSLSDSQLNKLSINAKTKALKKRIKREMKLRYVQVPGRKASYPKRNPRSLKP